MEIHSLWGRRHGAETDPIELIAAYDEYTVDTNSETYEAFGDLAESLAEHRIIVLNVDDDAIHAAYARSTVETTIKECK